MRIDELKRIADERAKKAEQERAARKEAERKKRPKSKYTISNSTVIINIMGSG